MSKLTKQELDDLKEAGYVEGVIESIPENISPVIRAKIVEEWREKNGVDNYLDLPTAVDRQNELVRERAAADGDKEMQKATDFHPLDHDKDGRKGGSVKGQKKSTKKD